MTISTYAYTQAEDVFYDYEPIWYNFASNDKFIPWSNSNQWNHIANLFIHDEQVIETEHFYFLLNYTFYSDIFGTHLEKIDKNTGEKLWHYNSHNGDEYPARKERPIKIEMNADGNIDILGFMKRDTSLNPHLFEFLAFGAPSVLTKRTIDFETGELLGFFYDIDLSYEVQGAGRADLVSSMYSLPNGHYHYFYIGFIPIELTQFIVVLELDENMTLVSRDTIYSEYELSGPGQTLQTQVRQKSSGEYAILLCKQFFEKDTTICHFNVYDSSLELVNRFSGFQQYIPIRQFRYELNIFGDNYIVRTAAFNQTTGLLENDLNLVFDANGELIQSMKTEEIGISYANYVYLPHEDCFLFVNTRFVTNNNITDSVFYEFYRKCKSDEAPILVKTIESNNHKEFTVFRFLYFTNNNDILARGTFSLIGTDSGSERLGQINVLFSGEDFQITSGISEINYKNVLVAKTFPNPTTDYLIIEYDNIEARLTAVIYDTHGRRVGQQALSGSGEQINLTNLPSGTYHIQLLNERQEQVWSGSVIKM
jgi:hypothetical protein